MFWQTHMRSRSSAQSIWFRDASIRLMQQVATGRGGGVGVGVGAESRNKIVFYRHPHVRGWKSCEKLKTKAADDSPRL